MRLRNLLKELEDCRKSLEMKKSAFPGNLISIQNYGNLIDTLLRLKEFSFLKKIIAPIEKETFFSKTIGDTINISAENCNKLESVVVNLKRSVDLSISLLREIVKEQDSDTISLKLHDMTEFKEFVDFNEDLYKIILRPLTYCGIEIEVGELEEGSRWQSFITHSFIGLALITSIFRSASDFMLYDVQKQRVINQVVETYIEIGKSETELEELKKSFDEARKKELEKRANDVITELEENVSNEKNEKKEKILQEQAQKNELITSIQHSIDCSYKYIDKGLEIYQALNVSEEKRFQLPNFQELLLQKKQLLLEEK